MEIEILIPPPAARLARIVPTFQKVGGECEIFLFVFTWHAFSVAHLCKRHVSFNVRDCPRASVQELCQLFCNHQVLARKSLIIKRLAVRHIFWSHLTRYPLCQHLKNVA